MSIFKCIFRLKDQGKCKFEITYNIILWQIMTVCNDLSYKVWQKYENVKKKKLKANSTAVIKSVDVKHVWSIWACADKPATSSHAVDGRRIMELEELGSGFSNGHMTYWTPLSYPISHRNIHGDSAARCSLGVSARDSAGVGLRCMFSRYKIGWT